MSVNHITFEIKEDGDYNDYCNRGGIAQPQVFLNMMANLIRGDNRLISFGYIKNDDIWHFIDKFNNLFETINSMSNANASLYLPFEWIEKNVGDPGTRGFMENKISGSGSGPLGILVAYSHNLWHDTSKAIAYNIGTPLQESVDNYYAKDKKITDKNVKIKALKRIRVWLDVIIDAVSYIEERTDFNDFSKPKTDRG